MMDDVDTGDHDAMPHEEFVGRTRVFDGKMLHVVVDDVRLPSGRQGVREMVEHPGSAVIVPVTRDGNVLMVRQYRYAVGEYLLELPAGLVDPGEDPAATAARELVEETGYRAGTIEQVAEVYVSPGYSQELTRVFVARECEPVAHEADVDEPLQVVHVPLDEVPALLTPGSGAVRNALTMIGLLWLMRRDG